MCLLFKRFLVQKCTLSIQETEYLDNALSGHSFFHSKTYARFGVITGYKASDTPHKRLEATAKNINFQNERNIFSESHGLWRYGAGRRLLSLKDSPKWTLSLCSDKSFFLELPWCLVLFQWQLDGKVIFSCSAVTSGPKFLLKERKQKGPAGRCCGCCGPAG